jgi:hypothetical protein
MRTGGVKPLTSAPNSNRRTRKFRELFDALPKHIQDLARAAFRLFQQNPDHPSLRRHTLADNNKGRHRADSISVSISMQYRAVYVVVDGVNVWYWIGTHAQYKAFTGSKR